MGKLKSNEALQIERLTLLLEAEKLVTTTLRSLIDQQSLQKAGLAEAPCARHCEINAHKKQTQKLREYSRQALALAREVRSDSLFTNTARYEKSKNLVILIANMMDCLGEGES